MIHPFEGRPQALLTIYRRRREGGGMKGLAPWIKTHFKISQGSMPSNSPKRSRAFGEITMHTPNGNCNISFYVVDRNSQGGRGNFTYLPQGANPFCS